MVDNYIVDIFCRMEEVVIMESLMFRFQDWWYLLIGILELVFVLCFYNIVVDVCLFL